MRELMVLVERAVRPVRAGPRRKLRIREELFAHLTAVFEEERARLGDDCAALAKAAERFGDPAELTGELEASLSWRDRLEGRFDRWFGWRPPESAARYSLRMAVVFCLACVPWALLALALTAWRRPADSTVPDALTLLRCIGAFMLAGGVVMFLGGVLYFKVRNVLCGGLGESRSQLRAAGWAVLFIPIALAAAFGIFLAATLSWRESLEMMAGPATLYTSHLLILLAPLYPLMIASQHGPAQIRHTEWSCLDIGD
jgi:ATP-dependent Clp protease ATP-binding subunit ClpC